MICDGRQTGGYTYGVCCESISAYAVFSCAYGPGPGMTVSLPWHRGIIRMGRTVTGRHAVRYFSCHYINVCIILY